MPLASLVLAAGGVPPFVPVVATIVIAAALAGWVSQRIGLVPIVGFLVAGVLVGPNALGVIDEVDSVEVAAEVGVILLLFTIGIEFSLERLARVKKLVLGGGSATVALSILVTAGVVLATGAGWRPSVYTGLLVSVSSTAVVLSLLASRRETSTPGGQLTVAVLVFEDLAVVGMILVVPMLGTDGGSIGELALALLTAAAVIVAVIVVARRVMPRVLEALARVCAPEVFLLGVLAICFATAYLTSLAGVSVSLGAFLAGLVVSESRFSAHAIGEILPLQIVFTATFFVSVGMLLDPGFLVDEPLLVLALVGAVLAIKALTGTVAARVVGVALPVAAASALMRAQIGEFSFVLEQVGHDAGLTPADLGENGVQGFLAASVLLMVATPAFAGVGARLAPRLPAGHHVPGRPTGTTPATDATDTGGHGAGDASGLVDHVVVAGYGDAARTLVPGLRDAEIPFVVLTLSPRTAARLDEEGLPVLRGDSTKVHALEEAEVRRAAVVVIADDDPETAARITELVRSTNPSARVVVRVPDDHAAAELAAAGAHVVVTDERAGWEVLAGVVVEESRAALLYDPGPHGPDTHEVVRFAPAPGACPHTTLVHPVLPGTGGCQECLERGDTWVHLRVCLSCGHVGCCDDSPNRHARAHAAEDAHPVARSIEPGESWAWCYVDEVELSDTAGRPTA